MAKNVVDKGEQACNMVLLLKDHKNWNYESGKPPPSRPVVSGNTGLNCHLSELLSLLLEPVSLESNGHEVDSTTELLNKIENLNHEFNNGLCDQNAPVPSELHIDELEYKDESTTKL